LTYHIVITKNL